MKKEFIKNLLSKIRRPQYVNKNDFGHILIIGGDKNMQGATILAAESCYRCGAGKVSVINNSSNYSALISRLPNAMTINDDLIKNKDWQKIFSDKTIIIIGPGLGQSKWSQEMLDITLKSTLPKIIDADALNLIAKNYQNINLNNSIITPHEGEASRILKLDLDYIIKNRTKSLQKLYEKTQAISLLKGSETLIYDGQQLYQCDKGNPGMASAGMGDVLCGMIAGIFSQNNLTLFEATILATEIHCQAGNLANSKFGEISLMATDLIANIPEAIMNLRND